MDYREQMREGEDVLRAMPAPTPEQDAALSLELARENALAAAEEAWDDDDPRYFCEHCGEAALPDEKDDEGYCLDCQRAMSETYASIHPRPEEVG